MGVKVRFYTATAPEWWRYQLVSAANKRLPKIKPLFYKVLIDNGAFAWFKRGEKPDPVRHWHETVTFVNRVVASLRPIEVWVILPDYPWDTRYTIEQARSQRARELCERVNACVVSAQAPRRPSDWPGCAGSNAVKCYARIAEEIASIEWVRVIAAPCKLQCSRITLRGRRLVDAKCQVAIVEQVCEVARAHGLGCHVLGAKMDVDALKRMIERGMTSFDSTTWTRPRNTVEARTAYFSAIGPLKDEFFACVVEKLRSGGIPLEE